MLLFVVVCFDVWVFVLNVWLLVVEFDVIVVYVCFKLIVFMMDVLFDVCVYVEWFGVMLVGVLLVDIGVWLYCVDVSVFVELVVVDGVV